MQAAQGHSADPPGQGGVSKQAPPPPLPPPQQQGWPPSSSALHVAPPGGGYVGRLLDEVRGAAHLTYSDTCPFLRQRWPHQVSGPGTLHPACMLLSSEPPEQRLGGLSNRVAEVMLQGSHPSALSRYALTLLLDSYSSSHAQLCRETNPPAFPMKSTT